MDNISEVKQKIDIIQLLNSYVPLKKAGKNYRGLCPFHTEKTPSFMVSEELQRYRCFGCGKSGDIFNFVMDSEGIDFSEALKMLAAKAGIKLDLQNNPKTEKERGQKQKIIDMNKLSARFYSHLLLKHEYGAEAKEYLNKRGIKSSTIETFQIGYAPKSWNSLSKYLISRGFSSNDIVKAGLGKYRKGNRDTYDMFRGRLMFPLSDHMGQILGFAGRALSEGQDPKYINTQETEIFHKEKFLFGLDVAKTSIRKSNVAIVVEGEFDMISPYQAGYKNIVASKGTALTIGQVTLLKRYADTIVLIFDNDIAGAEASIRGINVIKNCGLDIKIAILPKDAKDPDDLVLRDPKLFKEIIERALPLWDYYFVYANNKYDLSNVFEKKKASEFLLNMICEIDNEVIKAQYIKKFSVLFDVNESDVRVQLDKAEAKTRRTVQKTERDAEKLDNVSATNGLEVYPSAEVYFLTLLTKIDNAEAKTYIDLINEDYFVHNVTRQLFAELKSAKSFNTKMFYDRISKSRPDAYSLFEKIYLLDVSFGDGLDNSAFLGTEITSAIHRLEVAFQKRRLKDLAGAMHKAETVSNTKLVIKLQKEAQKISKGLSNLSS